MMAISLVDTSKIVIRSLELAILTVGALLLDGFGRKEGIFVFVGLLFNVVVVVLLNVDCF